MFLHNGFKFDRFGDEIEVSGGGVSETELDRKVREVAIIVGSGLKQFEDKISVIEGKLSKDVYDKVKKLLEAIHVTSECVKIKGNRRICGVAEGKSSSDVVILKHFVELNKKLVIYQEEVNKMFKRLDEKINHIRHELKSHLEILVNTAISSI